VPRDTTARRAAARSIPTVYFVQVYAGVLILRHDPEPRTPDPEPRIPSYRTVARSSVDLR